MYKILLNLYNRLILRGSIMDTLQKHDRFYFENEKSFRIPHDNVHFFLMSNYSIGMHQQDFFEINIITRGRGVHYIDNSRIATETGDVFIIPPNMPHGYVGGEGFDVYHILMNNKYVQKSFSDLQSIPGFSLLFNIEPMMRAKMSVPLHLKLTTEQLRSISDLLNDRQNQIKVISTEEAFINTGTFLIIVTKLCQYYIKNTSASNKESEMQDAMFMRALAMIHEKYNEKLTIERLASEAKLSKSTFMRRFLYICKLTPAEYITRKRLDVAENMLISTNASISDIAEKIGFYDTAHFSRTFKKVNGVTPLEYRKQKLISEQ